MSLSPAELTMLLDYAKDAAMSAGAIIKERQGKAIQTMCKDGGENIASQVVTEVDLACEKVIVDTLCSSLERFDLALLTEEAPDSGERFKKSYFWCIDPLDGTLAFSRNQDGYSVSIGLVSKEGIPVVGVVYNPRHDKLYSATVAGGAHCNGHPLRVDNSGTNLTLLLDQSYKQHPQFEEHLELLDQLGKRIGARGLRIHELGGAVMNGVSTVEMGPALYYKFPKKAAGGGSLWDFAANSVIQSQAGGINSAYSGSPLDLNRTDSTFMNHEGVMFCSSIELSESLRKCIPD